MRQYRVSHQADADLMEIWLFVAQENQEAADRPLDRIYESLQNLADMADMGHRRDEFADPNLRFWPVGQYLIIHRIETDPLEIVRIVSGYRNIAALLME